MNKAPSISTLFRLYPASKLQTKKPKKMFSYRASRDEFTSDDSSTNTSISSTDFNDESSSFSLDELTIVTSSQDSNSSSDSGLDDQNDANERNYLNDQNEPPKAAEKVNIRRQKNRESAARSRKRIKEQLETLEVERNFQYEKKEALVNHKALLTKEVEQLESDMIAFSLGKIKNPVNELEDHKYILSGDNNKVTGISIASH